MSDHMPLQPTEGVRLLAPSTCLALRLNQTVGRNALRTDWQLHFLKRVLQLEAFSLAN